MSNKECGKFTDYLSRNEVINSQEYAAILAKSGNWDVFLKTNNIKNALNIKQDPERTFDELNSIKSALFEVRFAHLIHQLELTAEYEFNLNIHGNKKSQQPKTIDFKINVLENTNILVELSSLRERYCQKKKTWIRDEFFGCCLGGNDEVSEYFKIQNILIEKAKKFPSAITKNQYNIIVLDVRSSILNSSDCYDYHNVLSRILCLTHQSDDGELDHLRRNIHYFGFVVEKKYTPDELANEIKWFKNPKFNKLPDLKEIFYTIK